MDMLFKNETKLDDEGKGIFKRFMLFKYNNDFLLLIPVFLIFLSVMAAVSMFWLVKRFIDSGDFAVENLLVFGVCLLIIIGIMRDILNLKKKQLLFLPITIILFCSLLLIVQIVLFDMEEAAADTSLVCLYLTIIIVMITTLVERKKKQKSEKEILWRYECYEEYMMIYTDISSLKVIFKENEFVKDICKYKGYIFLMNSKKSAWIMNENSFTIGNKEDFYKYIQEKINITIKDCNKKSVNVPI